MRSQGPDAFYVGVSFLGDPIERSGFDPWPGHCVVFLYKTLYSDSASRSLKKDFPNTFSTELVIRRS